MKKNMGNDRGYFSMNQAVYFVVAILSIFVVTVFGFIVVNTESNTASAKVVVTDADNSSDNHRMELWEASSKHFVSMLSVARRTDEYVESYGKVYKNVSVSLKGHKKAYELFKKKGSILVVDKGSDESKVKISGEDVKDFEYWLNHGSTKDTSPLLKMIAK